MTGRRRGSSLLEFALGIAVLAPVVVGVAKMGATVYVMDQLGAVARDAAQYASTQPAGLTVDDPAFLARVRNVAVRGNPEGSGEPRIAGLEARHVSVEVVREGGVPRSVAVWIANYEAPGGAVKIESGPHAIYPYRGRIASGL